MKTTESKNVNGLCEWCGKPFTASIIVKIADDYICPNCYKGYRKDKQHVKELRKGVKSDG